MPLYKFQWLGILFLPLLPFITNVYLRILYIDEFSKINFVSFLAGTWVEGVVLLRWVWRAKERRQKVLPTYGVPKRTGRAPLVLLFGFIRIIKRILYSRIIVALAIGLGAFSSLVDYEFMTVAGSPLDHHVLGLVVKNFDYVKSVNTSWNNGDTRFLGIPLTVWMVLIVYMTALWGSLKLAKMYFSADGQIVLSKVPKILLGILFIGLLHGEKHIGVVSQQARATVFAFQGEYFITALFGYANIPDARSFNMYQEVCMKNNKPKPKFNVLILLNEGISSVYLNSANGKKAASFYHNFLKEQQEYVFNYTGVTSAGVTEVSIVNFMCGFSADYELLRSEKRNPTMWALAKSACYDKTALFSSHNEEFGMMNKFVYDDLNLDTAFTKDKQHIEEVAIDLCADDRKIVGEYANFVNKTHDSTFFTMYHFCLTHTPYMVDEKDQPFDEVKLGKAGRYYNTFRLWDKQFQRIITALQGDGRLHNTVVMMMSDHGQNLGMSRTWKMEPLDLLVPFWIYVPASVQQQLQPSQLEFLKKNQQRVASNLDFYPTIMDLINVKADDLKLYTTEDNKSLPFLTGNSLLQELPNERYLVTLNTGYHRAWWAHPFALTRDSEEGSKLLIYNYSNKDWKLTKVEPWGVHNQNQWHVASDAEKQKWFSVIEANPVLKIIKAQ